MSIQFWKKHTIEDNIPLPVSNDSLKIQNFVWKNIHPQDEKELQKLQSFISKYYVSKGPFSIAYDLHFFDWVLSDNKPFINLSLQTENGIMVAFCKGYETRIKIEGELYPFFITTLLCIHPKYRGKHLVDKVVKEMLNRMFKLDHRYGLTISQKIITDVVCSTSYYNRFLNPLRLFELKFASPSKHLTSKRAQKIYATKEAKGNFEPLSLSNMNKAYSYFLREMDSFKISHQPDLDEFKRWFMPNGCVHTFVEIKDGQIIGFTSFYIVYLQVQKKVKMQKRFIKVAYNYYTFSHDLENIYNLAFTEAKKIGCDVYTLTDQMNNSEVLEKLLFKKSNTEMHYFLYNKKYKCEAKDMAVNCI